MFQLIFGIIWTSFVTPIFIMCLVIPGEQRNGADMNLFLFIFFLVFEAIGIFLIAGGSKKIIKDRKTKKHGKPCYGMVIGILESGTYVNGSPEYKATLQFVNPENNQLETIEEIVGFDYNRYPIDSFVQCKYYEGDINLESLVPEDVIPEEIKNQLIMNRQEHNESNLEFSDDKEYVVIDGVQYKKNQ